MSQFKVLKKKVAAVVKYTCVLAQFSSDYYRNPHCEDGGFDIVGAVIAVFKTNHHSREKKQLYPRLTRLFRLS